MIYSQLIQNCSLNLRSRLENSPFLMKMAFAAAAITSASGFVYYTTLAGKEEVKNLAQRQITTNVVSKVGSIITNIVSIFLGDEQEDIIYQALRIIPNFLDSLEKSRLREAVSRIPAGERQTVITQALRLISNDMDGNIRVLVINILLRITPGLRERVVTRALEQLVLDRPFLERRQLAGRIQVLLETPLNQPFPRLNDQIAALTIDERETVITQATRLIPPDNMYEDVRVHVINSLLRITPALRERIVARAAAQFANDRHLWQPNEVRARITALLETPLNQPFPPLNNNMAALAANRMARGINVHHYERDQRTRNALELLRANTGNMNDDEIEIEAALFISYLESFSDKTARETAQFVLNGISKTKNDFPPLFGDTSFTVAGLTFSGLELIARLWRFVDRFVDPNIPNMELEKENARESIIRALCDCIESDNLRVCNPGKVQRLVVGVLQGRLQGVNVDNLVMTDVVPVVVASRMFFESFGVRELHQKIGQFTQEVDENIAGAQERLQGALDSFFEKAKRFCDENANVLREEFLEEIKKVLD